MLGLATTTGQTVGVASRSVLPVKVLAKRRLISTDRKCYHMRMDNLKSITAPINAMVAKAWYGPGSPDNYMLKHLIELIESLKEEYKDQEGFDPIKFQRACWL